MLLRHKQTFSSRAGSHRYSLPLIGGGPNAALLFSLALFAHVFLAPGLAQAQSSSKASPALVQAVFNTRPDGSGGNLMIRNEAYVYDPNTGNFSFGLLHVDGNQFSNWHAQKMTPDGADFYFSGQGERVSVLRRITFHTATGTIRFVDTFQNASPQPVAINIGVTAHSRPGGAPLTNLGKPAVAGLQKGEYGIVMPTMSRTPGGQSAILYLAAENSKLKPTFQQSSGDFRVNYAVNVPAGGAASLVYGFARRPGAVPAQPKALEELFKPFKSRDWTKDLSSEVRRQIVNHGRTSGGASIKHAEVMSPLVAMLDEFGWEQSDEHDNVAFEGEVQLPGTIKPAPLRVTTVYGVAEVDAADIAAVVGSADARDARVYLKDGEVLRGKVDSPDWTLAVSGGLEVKFQPGRVSSVVCRLTKSPDDVTSADEPDPTGERPPSVPSAPSRSGPVAGGSPVSGDAGPSTGSGLAGRPTTSSAGKADGPAAALVGFADGNRLRVTKVPDAKITLVSLWGKSEVRLAALTRITQVLQPQPMQCFEFRDGTRLIGLVRREEIVWPTARFGDQTGSTSRLADYFSASPADASVAGSAADPAELALPHCELAGECRLVGDLAESALKLQVRGQIVELKRAAIVRIEPVGEDSPHQVVVQLSGDEELSGRLIGDRLRLSTGLGEQVIAVSQMIAFNRPHAEESSETSSSAAAGAEPQPGGVPKSGAVPRPGVGSPQGGVPPSISAPSSGFGVPSTGAYTPAPRPPSSSTLRPTLPRESMAPASTYPTNTAPVGSAPTPAPATSPANPFGT